MRNPQVSDIHRDIINRCRSGERDAYFMLYKLYSKSMFNVAYRILKDQDEAEDALQEGFISAFKNLNHFRGEASFGGWLKKIVIHKAINSLKKRREETLPDFERLEVGEEEVSFEIESGVKDRVDQVRQAIEELPDGYRSVLSLYLLEGYDHEEISEVLGISISTSKSQLNRAKTKLKKLLKDRKFEFVL